jgi:hypothetical protein
VNTCGSCAHWGDKNKPDEDPMFRACQAVVHDKEWATGKDGHQNQAEEDDFDFERDVAADIKAEIKAVRKHLAVVQDGSGFYAALKVREDFGCVLWKAKS